MCLQIYDIILKPPNFLHRNVYNMGLKKMGKKDAPQRGAHLFSID